MTNKLVSRKEFVGIAKDVIGRDVTLPAINYWAKQGLVVVVDGKVDVDASMERLKAHVGARPDVAERHAIEHAAKSAGVPESADQTQPNMPLDKIRHLRALSDARIKAAEAEMREMERDKLAGRLVDKEDVEFVLKDYGATLRSLMETFADRVAPLVLPLDNLDDVHAVLTEEAARVVTDLAEAMRRKAHVFSL